MKKYIILTLFMCTVLPLFSQVVYYGCPTKVEDLKKGDIIVINNIPNIDGRYIKSDRLYSFIEFMKSISNYKVRLEINIAYGSKAYSEYYSNSLCNSLKIILTKENNLTNCTFKSNGNLNPIFNDSISPYFKFYNTRTEIVIE